MTQQTDIEALIPHMVDVRDGVNRMKSEIESLRSRNEELRKALQDDAELRHKIGGCSDGGCIIEKPQGMHTNGGCKCNRNPLKMAHFAYAHMELVKAIAAATAHQEVKVQG